MYLVNSDEYKLRKKNRRNLVRSLAGTNITVQGHRGPAGLARLYEKKKNRKPEADKPSQGKPEKTGVAPVRASSL